MTLKHRLLLSFVKVAKYLLYWRVKSTLASPSPESLELNPKVPVFYVTRYRSLTDALVLYHECSNAKLPTPFESMTLEGNKGSESDTIFFWNQIIHLTRPGITQISSKSPRYFSDKLSLLIDWALRDPTFDVQLVPASVFWGRSPKTEGSFWQAAFSDTWGIPGFFRKFLMVMAKGRQTYVQMSQPFSLRQILEKETNLQRGTAKTHRLIRRRMKMQREAFIGPDLSHRRTLLLSILEQPSVKTMIERQAKKDDTSIEQVRKHAFNYVNEIAADYSHAVIRSMHVLLKWLWTRLYGGVRIHGGPRLQKLAQEHAIVYVPSHRSHMDYLLMSFVLYDDLELVPPHIAAGVNLNLPIIGPILRRGGAFFMRRSFKDNPLYAAIFSEYLHHVLDRGFAIEYFIEGGRSRTGRQLPPKPGMLSMTLESYASNGRRSLMFVPVNFSYERLFEGKSYLGELRGKKKPKESLSQFIKSLKRIKENFGQVHVNFGEPLCANTFLANVGLRNDGDFGRAPHPQQKQIALKLGNLISQRINASATAHPIALASIVIQASAKQAIEEELLISQLALLLDLLRAQPYHPTAVVIQMDPTQIIRYAEDLDYICRYPNQFGDILFATEKQAQFLSYFRNNVLHFFALPSLLALLYHNRQELSDETILQQAQDLYPLLQAELFLQWSPAAILAVLEDTLHYLKKELRLFEPPQKRNLELLAGVIRPSLERFAIVLTLLEKAGSGTITSRELESQARIHAERISRLYQINSPEYFDSKLFNNLVAQLFTGEIVKQDDNGKLVFGTNLGTAMRQTETVLGTTLRHTLWTENH